MEKGHSTVKKVFTVIGNIIIWLFVIFAAVVTIFTFAARSSEDGVPSIGKTTILTVSTDSMSPEFNAGDIIIGQKLLPEEQVTLQKGDVITYDAGDLDGNGSRDLHSHRIIEVIKGENGNVSYKTQGDNVLTPDPDPVDSENVICKYTGTKLAGLGKVLNFLQTSTGFLLVIVLPLVLFFIYELIRFIRRFIELRGGRKGDISPEEEERIRQQAIEEYLRSQAGEQAPAAEEAAEAVEEAAEETAEAVTEAATEEAPADE